MLRFVQVRDLTSVDDDDGEPAVRGREHHLRNLRGGGKVQGRGVRLGPVLQDLSPRTPHTYRLLILFLNKVKSFLILTLIDLKVFKILKFRYVS